MMEQSDFIKEIEKIGFVDHPVNESPTFKLEGDGVNTFLSILEEKGNKPVIIWNVRYKSGGYTLAKPVFFDEKVTFRSFEEALDIFKPKKDD